MWPAVWPPGPALQVGVLPWPAEALQSVAEQFLSKIDDLPQKDGIVAICVDMQERVLQLTQRYLFELRRYYYVTPTSYLILIKTFTMQLERKRMSNGNDIAKYEDLKMIIVFLYNQR